MPSKQHYLRSSPPKPREPIHATSSPKQHETMQKKSFYVESEEENNTDLEDEDMDTTDSFYNSHKLSVKRSLNSSKEDTREKARKTPQNRQYKSGDNKQDDHEQDAPDSIKKRKLETQINKVKSEKNNSAYSGSHFLFVACFLALVGVLCYHISDETSTLPDNRNLLEKFNADMKDFQSMFPAQTRRFLKIIRVSLKRIIVENNPDYPAILLLVAPSGSKSSATGTCIAKQLTKNMNTLFNVTSARVINIPNDIRHNNPDDEKKDLDNKIKDSFQNEHIRSLAVDHFEQLSPRASLLFHGYCDGDNAPFKNVAIVFILHTELDKDLLQQDSRLIDDHLRKLWSSSEYPLDQDKIDPLIARVANNAAVITEEENLKC